MALSSGGSTTVRALRTAPPAYAAPGVASIGYRGTYPVGRLDISDPALTATSVTASVYAYHHFVPNDAPTSSAPAAVFTLALTNAGATAVDASFMLQLPFGAMADCSRVDYPVASTSTVGSAAACLHACAATAGCAAWNWVSATGACDLLPSAGRMIFSADTFCGINGSWDSSDGTSLDLAMHPDDAASVAGPAWGDVALRPVSGDSDATLSFAVGDVPADLFAAFAAGGGA